MLSIPSLNNIHNHIFNSRSPPGCLITLISLLQHFQRRNTMNYLESYREMISLRGLTDHTVKSYSTYIRAYLEYLSSISISPEDASWDIMRDFIRHLQKSRSLSDRTVNACISQLRFFTLYVLHRPWDSTQL